MTSTSSKHTEWERKHRRIAGKGKARPVDLLRELWLYNTDFEIAEAINATLGLDITKAAVRQKRQGLGLNKTGSGVPLVFKDSAQPRFNKALVIESDNVCVMADVHAPFQDAEWCSRVLDIARRREIKTCVIAGDLFDMASLSTFTPAMIAEDGTEVLLSDELMAAVDFSETLLSQFDKVIITLGNHEARLAKKLGRLSASVFKLLLGYGKDDAVTVSEYAYCKLVSSNGQRWRVTHPKNSSVIPVRVAARMTEKYESNVVAAHGHDWGEATGVSGRYAAACGMCGDPLRIDYATKTDNTRPLMQQGAWLLVDGLPVLLHPRWRPPENL